MIYLMLYLVFAKIAVVAFGGGYANLPIIQSELMSRGWCTAGQFADIVAIAQMTPGPVVINTATYVGKTMAGIPGGIIATLGFITPAVLITVAIYFLAEALSSVKLIKHGIRGIRAGVAGLILCAVIFFVENSVLNHALDLNRLIYDFSGTVKSWSSLRLVLPAVVVLLMNLFFIKKTQLSIYICIIISVIIGTPLMYLYSLL
ncbi:MAG: chromate transporter [Spirochaetia bacterium]|nr:chromate transporter [Spirochaetia bacterium]MBQ3648288.1 chromate transporter [Spirochaetia bacterium]MBQ3713445.1 chromate transporter [Spirochaetia bacterium]MBQ6673963.1 chromate transporter [Spirochaetia bacterium]MBQ6905134.1 chromate transporter [Spirochaetia bacterium]